MGAQLSLEYRRLTSKPQVFYYITSLNQSFASSISHQLAMNYTVQITAQETSVFEHNPILL